MSDQQASSDLREMMRGLRFLEGLNDPYVQKLAELGTLVQFSSGTIIFAQSQPASSCYLILEGSIVLEICGTGVGCTQIQTVGEGDLLGWSTILGAQEMTSTARTLSETKAIEFNGHEIQALCEQNTEFGFQFLRCTAHTLAQRLTSARLQVFDVFRNDVMGTH